jgi:Ca2+-binding RTX toxin-like protein
MTLTGNEFANTIIGNAGVNVLIGGAGLDVLSGRGGNDFYRVEQTGDVVLETAGGGNDAVYAVVSYTLGAGQEIEMLSAIDPTSGGALDLTGNEFANTVIGSAGTNNLNGGAGADALHGNGGADNFTFTTTLGGGNIDAILDFSVAAGDKVVLDDAVFTGLGLGALSADAFVSGPAALDGNDRIIYDRTTGALYFDADGSNAGAAVQFATVHNAPLLSASDFMVI